MPNAGFATRRILNVLLRRFHERNPGIRVKTCVFPWSTVWDRLMAVLKQGHSPLSPDVIQIGSTWTSTLAYLGALQDLTPYGDRMDPGDFFPTIFNSCRQPETGKLHAVPWFMDVRVLYYRRDILRSLGVKTEELQTWSSFQRVCRWVTRSQKKKKNFHTLALSGQKEQVRLQDLAPWIWSAGGRFFTDDEKRAAFHQESALEGIHFFFSLMAEGCIPLLGRDRFASGDFFNGQAVFQFSGAWPLESHFKKGAALYHRGVAENFGVVPFPQGPAGHFTYLGGSHLAVSSGSRHPEESRELLRFLTSREAQLPHARAIGRLPCRQSEIQGLFMRTPEVGRVFQESLGHARMLPQVPALGTLERLFMRCTSDIVKMIVDRRFSRGRLHGRLCQAAQETNYLPSLYA